MQGSTNTFAESRHMNTEMMLVCKIIQTGKMSDVLEFGITEDDLLTPEAKTIFQRQLAVFQSADSSGSVLGPTMARKVFPNLPWTEVDEHVTVEHLCHEVRKSRLRSLVHVTLNGAVSKLQAEDLDGAMTDLQQMVSQYHRIGVSRNHDTPGYEGLQHSLDTFERRKLGLDPGVCQWAWYGVGEHTGPIYDDDYIVFYGRPKNMKSWCLFFQAADCVFNQDIPVVIYTKEMTKENVYQRLASIATQLPYGPIRMGTLVPDLEKRFKVEMQHLIHKLKMREKDNLLWVLSGKDMPGRDTISWFRSKVEKYKPKVAFIDGMYLMTPENAKLVKPNERLENVSRAARQLILDLKVPLFCTLQANRQAAKHEKGEMDEIAMSDAVSQDCTAAIRTIKDKVRDPATGKNTCSLVVAGAREWNMSGWRIFAEPSTDFTFIKLLDDNEVLHVAAADSEDGEKKKNEGKSKKGVDTGKIQKLVANLSKVGP